MKAGNSMDKEKIFRKYRKKLLLFIGTAIFSLKSLSLTLPGAVTIQPRNGSVFRKIANYHTIRERDTKIPEKNHSFP